ncbi:MAG TPA: class I SAM-dependent methyltransferase [Thermoanaerobaculia bacterium]|nr:class I SAM-dependent methyltransferase [Thermoanaerobaculia bacterium]
MATHRVAEAPLPLPLPAPAPTRRGVERRRWERVAGSFRDFYEAPTTQYYRRCEIALIGRLLGPLAGRRVLKLDLWNEAFNTRILHWMAGEGAEVYGMDLSQRVTITARGNSSRSPAPLRLLSADIRELPFADGFFDAVYTMGTIEHIAEYRHTLCEIRRVLRPGGRAIVGVPHRWNLFLRPLLVACLERFGLYPYAPEKSFGARELRRDLEAAGLAVTARSGILTLPGLLRMADVFCFNRGIVLRRLSPLMVAPFQYAETRWRWPGRFGYLMAMLGERPAAPRAAGDARPPQAEGPP